MSVFKQASPAEIYEQILRRVDKRRELAEELWRKMLSPIVKDGAEPAFRRKSYFEDDDHEK